MAANGRYHRIGKLKSREVHLLVFEKQLRNTALNFCRLQELRAADLQVEPCNFKLVIQRRIPFLGNDVATIRPAYETVVCGFTSSSGSNS